MAYKSLITSRGPRKCPPDGPEVWVFWGATGTGKSRRAFETWPDAYRKMTNDKWWDGYHGERQSSSTTSRALPCVYMTSSSL